MDTRVQSGLRLSIKWFMEEIHTLGQNGYPRSERIKTPGLVAKYSLKTTVRMDTRVQSGLRLT